ncbi:PCZ1.1 (plasmid) [Planococcus sp. PAMC 21323]|nr:PCZ1.1 [Planococcus sp. PAMC 21323]
MQLLAYSIFCTQKNGVTEFRKTDFEEKFGVLQYRTEDALKDSDKITSIKFSTVDMENEKFKFWNAFIGMGYDKGLFTFEWSPKMLPHILEVKEKYYVTTDLTIASNFKSSFSWTLYDYLKAHYGCWYKNISKNELMELFGVQDINSYQINTAMFKKRVLDIAIKEINEHTELEVSYKSLKEGRTITGFKIDWSNGTKLTSATKKQINEIKNIVDTSFDNMFQYVDLDNTQDRQRAIDLVRKIEKLRIFTGDDIGITNEKASQLIQTAILDFKRLNHLLEKNNLELSRDTVKKVEFYNWLEDKG